MKVRLLKRHEIDDNKWDDCVINSVNSRHYAMVWHLDIVSPGWRGMVYGNYKAVMPVPLVFKFGLPLILQPFLCQQLGIFSHERLGSELTEDFHKILKKPYPVVYNINLLNTPHSSSGLKLEYLPNIELDMNKEYSVLKNRFSKNTKRNISKAKSTGLIIKKTLPNEDLYNFIFNNLRFNYSQKEQQLYKRVIDQSFTRGEGVLVSCLDNNEELLAIALFIIHKNRITFMGSSSSNEGYKKHAAFYIFDRVIDKYSNRGFTLDFEGSRTEGVARFYMGFGGEVTEYGQIKNRSFIVYQMFRMMLGTN